MTYKILVTGGAGFIGSHLVDKLIREGHGLRVFDNLEPQIHGNERKIPEYLNKEVEFIKGDVRDIEELKKAVNNVEVIFHEAAMVGVGQSMYKVKKYTDVNTSGTANLLDILVNEEHDVKKLIVASSMSIYGEGRYECENCGVINPGLRPDKQLRNKEWEMKCPNCGMIVRPIPTDESKPPQPTSIYSISKKDQEEMCLAIGKAYGIPTVALRYFNVYGPRQSLSNPYTGVCAIFSSRIKNGNSPLVFENGLQTRDFIDVKDIVLANLLAMEKSNADYEVFNIGTGASTTISEIVNILIKLYNKDLEPEIVNTYRSGDIRHCFADISKIEKLGFRPQTRFEKGMHELVKWGETQIANDKSEEARRELKEKGLI